MNNLLWFVEALNWPLTKFVSHFLGTAGKTHLYQPKTRNVTRYWLVESEHISMWIIESLDPTVLNKSRDYLQILWNSQRPDRLQTFWSGDSNASTRPEILSQVHTDQEKNACKRSGYNTEPSSAVCKVTSTASASGEMKISIARKWRKWNKLPTENGISHRRSICMAAQNYASPIHVSRSTAARLPNSKPGGIVECATSVRWQQRWHNSCCWMSWPLIKSLSPVVNSPCWAHCLPPAVQGETSSLVSDSTKNLKLSAKRREEKM